MPQHLPVADGVIFHVRYSMMTTPKLTISASCRLYHLSLFQYIISAYIYIDSDTQAHDFRQLGDEFSSYLITLIDYHLCSRQ